MNHLNLMPVARRRRLLRRRRLKQWGLVVLLVVLGAFAFAVSEVRVNTIRESEADALARQYEPIKVMQDKIDAIKKQIETLTTQKQLAAELAKQKSIVSLMGLLSNAAERRGDRICIRRLILDSKRIETETGAHFERDLTIEGLALSSGDISVFSSSLEESNAFTRVHLESSTTRQIGRLEAQAYALQCTY